MTFTLPKLPYELDALEPHISKETLAYHYGKHHQGYVNKLNALIESTEFKHKTLEDIIKASGGAMFNNAAQVWNHTFYWNCLSPTKNQRPSDQLYAAINQYFGSLDDFKMKFSEAATVLFGSGWAWLVKNPDQSLEIVSIGNAGNPITKGQIPLLTCDVWEHAYYIDYRNARATYVEHFWHLVNWNFVGGLLHK
ncbi:MAG: superoxide dismutase [Fe] [Gammaproteobacteria bacterium]|nr:superoxide dismutase [Fe] [Gammaproteobacteria bacterium]